MPVEKPCENCGQTFYCYPSDIEAGRKYCSIECRSKHRFSKPLPAASRVPIPFTCNNCGNGFTMMRGYLTAYQKKFGRDPVYCSMKCSAEGRRKTADEKNKFVCEQCGKIDTRSRKAGSGNRIYREQKYCSPACKAESQKTKALDKFNRGEFGRHIKRHGYVWISVPSLVTGKKHAVMEHRYVMSRHIGRELSTDETVHHVNGNRQDNRIENLELFSSRHGPGQRVVDKVDFAIEMLTLYPEFARARGYELKPIHTLSDAPALP